MIIIFVSWSYNSKSLESGWITRFFVEEVPFNLNEKHDRELENYCRSKDQGLLIFMKKVRI